MALLFDVTRCIGCRSCMQGCRHANDLPTPPASEPSPPDLNSDNYTIVLPLESPDADVVYYRRLCMHCGSPACVSACPVNALVKREDGAVVYDRDRCIGCRYCFVACPFHVPTYSWESTVPLVRKCFLCAHRLDRNQVPGCAAACPTGATMFGPREALLKLAREQIAAHPDRYIDHILGEHEAGGTDVLMISSVPFEVMGLWSQAPAVSLPDLTWMVQEKIPYVIASGGLLLGGVYWIINRRMRLARESSRGGEERAEEDS
ncbi:MAG: 4Fe-4S dicluster domain-containing protein [Candidatus Eisenbacteria bacterium]|nr:4Fe-4S dicluster domain-containing protein [Candidatus Eisenbacteria bacterium]